MTNYESIKNMSIEQLTVTLYVLVAPFAEALNGGRLSEQERFDMIEKLKGFLRAEVKADKH